MCLSFFLSLSRFLDTCLGLSGLAWYGPVCGAIIVASEYGAPLSCVRTALV